MDQFLAAFDLDTDADETARFLALTDSGVAALEDPRGLHAIVPGRTSLSFALLMQLRRLTPSVQASAARLVWNPRSPARRPSAALAVALRSTAAVLTALVVWLRSQGRFGRMVLRSHSARFVAAAIPRVREAVSRGVFMAAVVSQRVRAVAARGVSSSRRGFVVASRTAMTGSRRALGVSSRIATTSHRALVVSFRNATTGSRRALAAIFRVGGVLRRRWATWAMKKGESLAS